MIVKIVGSIDELGKWNVDQGVELITDSKQYPLWTTKTPINVKLGNF